QASRPTRTIKRDRISSYAHDATPGCLGLAMAPTVYEMFFLRRLSQFRSGPFWARGREGPFDEPQDYQFGGRRFQTDTRQQQLPGIPPEDVSISCWSSSSSVRSV